jgi:hypothetical protein
MESFRQHVFENLTRGFKYLLDVLPEMGLELPSSYTDVDPETGCVPPPYFTSHFCTRNLCFIRQICTQLGTGRVWRDTVKEEEG